MALLLPLVSLTMMNSSDFFVFDEDESESSLNLIVDPPQTAVNGVISLAFVNQNFPFMYRNPHTGVISGIYVDMWRALAKMERKELAFEKGTVYGKEDGLSIGRSLIKLRWLHSRFDYRPVRWDIGMVTGAESRWHIGGLHLQVGTI